MAQFNWTYVSDTGRQHIVGLFHGERTGHLLVHCNSRILLIDFHVLQSKDYSFFIDEELFNLHLERKDNRFFYNFEINKEADTPKNRERRKTERKHLKHGLALLGLMALFVALIFFGLRDHQNNPSDAERRVLLAKSGRETIARVDFTPNGAGPVSIRYSFVADGRAYEGASRLSTALLDNGMLLEPGDEFILHYAANNPSVHEIDFQQPTEQQIQRYRQRAFERHAQLHPGLSDERINCVLDILYDLRGVEAYADLYFQDLPPHRYRRHNKETYYDLITDPDVNRRLEEACVE